MFDAIGCAACHVPSLETGPRIKPLFDRRTVPLYSDLLLHAVGTGDSIRQASAAPNEIRTPALWGLRFRRPPAVRRPRGDGHRRHPGPWRRGESCQARIRRARPRRSHRPAGLSRLALRILTDRGVDWWLSRVRFTTLRLCRRAGQRYRDPVPDVSAARIGPGWLVDGVISDLPSRTCRYVRLWPATRWPPATARFALRRSDHGGLARSRPRARRLG